MLLKIFNLLITFKSRIKWPINCIYTTKTFYLLLYYFLGCLNHWFQQFFIMFYTGYCPSPVLVVCEMFNLHYLSWKHHLNRICDFHQLNTCNLYEWFSHIKLFCCICKSCSIIMLKSIIQSINHVTQGLEKQDSSLLK